MRLTKRSNLDRIQMQEMTSSDSDCIAAVHNDKHDNDDNNGKKYED